TCGSVTNSCQQPVDCGACTCTPACADCFTCQDGLNTPGTCVIDPVQQGDACGSPGQVCQADGVCVCDGGSCSNPTPICAGGVCIACMAHAQCGVDALCVDGACQACNVTCAGGTCSSLTQLQPALALGGTVYVCPGRYTGNLTLTQNASLVGAGQGEDNTVDTILDALTSGNVVRNNSSVTAALRQVWITGGRGNNGAGVSNSGDLSLTDCTISDNSNTSQGGGIFTEAGTLEMIGCAVRRNSTTGASSAGGGLLIRGPATLTNCTIGPNNTADNTGGGIRLQNSSSPLTLNGSTVTGNSASEGGGIFNNAALLTLNGGSVTDNTAIGTEDIFNAFGRLIDNDATIGECTDVAGGCGCPGGTVCP
ncbi:MAG: right-handed parallel beta-helix repeat-containing protein, partial [Chloroflexota bacterium]|nr:right-handed parallel beta-helix repeat-containing protein [Chloroflexota bacterium]